MTTQKIALVTGANRGLGLEIARQLAAKGIYVLMAARNWADVDGALVTDVATRFDHLDILINNAGVNFEDSQLPRAEMFTQVFAINTIAPQIIFEAFKPLLEKSDAARVVNQSSRLGSIDRMRTDQDLGNEWRLPAYSASKAALNMLTAMAGFDWDNTPHKINVCHPGWVNTRMGGAEAPLSPSQGAATAISLALLPANGPNGGFYHEDEALPW
jgi:NAD(P)-dependent dehydrogenase (short-subunit alcohol dehydrogenase family)